MTGTQPTSTGPTSTGPTSTGPTSEGPRPITPGELVTAIRRTHERLGGAVEPLTDAQVRAPSHLAGWSRGHVLAHLFSLGAAVARQISTARRGELVDFYDGGRAGRDAEIEAGATAAAAEHVRALRRATEVIDELLAGLAPADWDRPVRFRDEVVLSVALAWWRETEIHLTDLDLGPDSDAWSLPFCDHLIDFLAGRAPAGMRLVLRAADGWVREVGAGTAFVVRGARTDLCAWMAGREPVGPVLADGGVALVPLGPWP
ncbi:MAG: maleylpyruvate isomerase family mycothiol-dependent enzyme [Cellulomonas sp.]